MALALGISVDVATGGATALASRAERAGLHLVVVEATDDLFDLWTGAVWIAAGTEHVPIGVPARAKPSAVPALDDPDAPLVAVVAKARESLNLLAGNRLLTADGAWVTATAGASRDEVEALGAGGSPVVVPVRSPADVDRLAGFVEPADSRRPAAALARRRRGIEYDNVPASLTGRAVEPGDPEYRAMSSNYLRGGSPGLVLRPRSPEEVADALAFATEHRHLPLGVRSGRHGISGRSTNDGGLVVDLGLMNRVEVVDHDRRLVRIGPGATWKQVAAALDGHGWALGSGDYGGVGVGGLATAGGIGLLSREHGLTIDHVRAVDLVLADGRIVRASRSEHPDLFWAVRGAGANFGVVTSFEFEVEEVGNVGYAHLALVTSDIERSLTRFGELAGTAPRDTTVFLVTGRPRGGEWTIELYAVVDHDDPDVIVERLTPFTELGALAGQQVVLTRYADVMGLAHDVGPEGHRAVGEPVSRSAFLPALTPEFARDAAALLRDGPVGFFQLRTMGGAIADVPAGETAFAHRDSAFQVTAMGGHQRRLDVGWDALGEHFAGLYLSFDTDQRPERLRDAFPPEVLARLRGLKRRYDPGNLFRDNFNIDPDGEAESSALAG